MHPYQPLLHIAAQLKHCVSARNYPGVALWLSRLLPPVAITWATDRPEEPEGRAAWESYGARVVDHLKLAAEKLLQWPEATGRRGVKVSTLWIYRAVLHAIDVLTFPGADDQGAPVAAIVPDQPGPTAVSRSAG